MKQFYTLFLSLVALVATAQSSPSVPFPKVQHWTGTGSKKAALVIAWHDGMNADTLVWGYRFEAPTTSAQMLEAVVKADPRLYAAVSMGEYGLYVEGLGYDRNNDAYINLSTTDLLTYAHLADGWWMRNKSGSAKTEDESDHFHGGYDAETGKFFAHLVSDEGAAFQSSMGASARQLKDGSIDVWSYQAWDAAFALSSYTAVPAAPHYNRGLFIVNEDQFGKHPGTVNHFNTDTQTWTYRAYQQANAGHTLGMTAQYATIYGGRFYFISKQNFKETGGRLVVANAGNLAQIIDEKAFPNGSDGRAIAFTAHDDELAFISTSKGIVLYNVVTKEFIRHIEGVDEECGRIVPVGDYLFIETANKQVIVVDAKHQKIKKRIDNACLPTLSRDGRLWVLRDSKLVGINVNTLEEGQTIDLGEKAPSFSAGAWNAGLLFAGNQKNTLYWGYGTGWTGADEVYRLNLDEAQPKAQLIYSLKGKETPNIYGAAMRLRPEDDHIFLQAFKSWGDMNYNLYELNADGQEVGVYPLKEQHYWFPALPVFPDVQAPVLTLHEALPKVLGIGESKEIAFTATDADSYAVGIMTNATVFEASEDFGAVEDKEVLEAKIEGDKLVLRGMNPGERQLVLHVQSNGLYTMSAHLIKVSNDPAGVHAAQITAQLSLTAGYITATDLMGETLAVYDLTGRLLARHNITSQKQQFALPQSTNTLVVRAGKLSLKVQR